MNIIEQLNAEQAAKIDAIRKLPDFQPGDTVRVAEPGGKVSVPEAAW